MWRIHRYYLRELAASSILTFLVLFGIVLVASVYRGLDKARGGDLVMAATITFFWAADTFPHLLAMSLLVAAVLTFARASQEREITALRAAGISPRVPMVAALLLGLAFSIAGSFAVHYLLPAVHYHKYRVLGEALRSLLVQTKMSGNKLSFGSLVMAWESEDEGGHLHDVLLKLGKRRQSGGYEPGQVYIAEEAWLDLSDDGATITLHLRGAENLAGEGIRGQASNIALAKSIRELAEEDRREEGDKDLSSDQLLSEVYRGVHDNPDGARFTVHRRTCFALMPCLFAPIGFCIGVLARERGRMTALLFGMAPMAAFYLGVVLAPTVVRAVDWPPVAYLPAAIVALLGLPFCWRLLRV